MSKVLFDVNDGVAVLTFNRPDSLNALDAETHTLLADTWVEIKSRPEIRALIVTGNGRGFCVGMDLKAVGERGEFRKTAADTPEFQTMTPLSNDIWIPTIVAVNGVCAGGGLHFVADADIVVASTAATFTDPHVTYGQVAALEPIGLIPRIGLGNSLRLALLGRGGRFDAAEALRICLVDEVVEPDDLLPRARELATAIARNSPTAVRRTKRAIWGSLDVPAGEAMRQGFEAFRSHREHPDALEGPRAFAEQRDPVWRDVDESDVTGERPLG
jgi:enoyl-CoA hydratase/carnithine racemase